METDDVVGYKVLSSLSTVTFMVIPLIPFTILALRARFATGMSDVRNDMTEGKREERIEERPYPTHHLPPYVALLLYPLLIPFSFRSLRVTPCRKE